MFRFEIIDIKIQNFEVKLVKRLEIISTYLKFLIFYPKNIEIRKHFLNMMRGLFIQFKDEKQVLDRLNSSCISYEDFITILNELDEIFDRTWGYYDDILRDFEITLALEDYDRVMLRKPEIKYFTAEKKDEYLRRIQELEDNSQPHNHI